MLYLLVICCFLALVASANAFTFTPSSYQTTVVCQGVQSASLNSCQRIRSASHRSSSLALSAVVEEDIEKPTELTSAAGIDYVPLATSLATGDFKAADQITRDALIQAAGEGSRKRGFVYWTDVKNIPTADMLTIDRLWLKHSNNKFGYSVQKECWRRSKGDFEKFCQRIGWNTKNAETERKLRWFGKNEFIYDVDKAPVGHLPLTSALRGTTLIKALLTHPAFDQEEAK